MSSHLSYFHAPLFHTPVIVACSVIAISGQARAYQPSTDSATDPETEQRQQINIISPTDDPLPRMGTDETPIEPIAPEVSHPHHPGLSDRRVSRTREVHHVTRQSVSKSKDSARPHLDEKTGADQ